ncbi:hypothetical protein [Nonomuraea dietziae]|uniref:hypothetical protein n=1 Tax=Nonomuraea dietziae TaxID=65515 RepID=UPI00340DA30C
MPGSTGRPDTQETPASPRGNPDSQRQVSATGPASSPRSARIAASASAVGSCSAERARSNDSAGSLPDSHGSAPTRATAPAIATDLLSDAPRRLIARACRW